MGTHRQSALDCATRIMNTLLMQEKVDPDEGGLTNKILKTADVFADWLGPDPVRQSYGGGGAKVEKPDYDKPCPVCGGVMVDDRKTKKNPKGPDAYCKNRGKWDPSASKFDGCAGVVWPPKDMTAPTYSQGEE